MRTTTFVFTFVGLTHILFVLRDLLLAHQFGNGSQYEAFMVTLIVPGFILNVFSGSISSSLIPKIIYYKGQLSKNEFSSYLLSLMIVISLCILSCCLAMGLFAFLWHTPLVAKLTQEQQTYARSLMIPSLILTALQALPVFIRTVFTALQRQIVATLGPLLNIIILVGLLYGIRPTQIEVYIQQVSIAYICELILMLGASISVITYQSKLKSFSDSLAHLFDRHFIFPMLSSLLGASALLIDQAMATQLFHGGVAALNYGQKITSSVVGVVSGAMGYLIFPELATYVSQKSWKTLKKKVKIYTFWIFFLSSILTFGLCYFSEDLIRILFERGAFKKEDTQLVSNVNIFYLLQIPFYLSAQVAIKSLYSLQKGHYMTRIIIFTIFINVGCNYLFSLWFGLAGISLSTSLIMLITAAALFWFLYKELRALENPLGVGS